LDNKELLAICDQLDIAVKSHSSTISETEAEQIRTAAEKLAATNVMPKKELTTSHKPNSPQIGGPSRPTAPHKQQILEIRKPKILRNTTSNAQERQLLLVLNLLLRRLILLTLHDPSPHQSHHQ
jgi:translation initiation factor IF-2